MATDGHRWPEGDPATLPEAPAAGRPEPVRAVDGAPRPGLVSGASVLLVVPGMVELTIAAALALAQPGAVSTEAVVAGGFATLTMLQGLRTWRADGWGASLAVIAVQLFVTPPLFGASPLGIGMVAGYTVALIGLVRHRTWFERPAPP